MYHFIQNLIWIDRFIRLHFFSGWRNIAMLICWLGIISTTHAQPENSFVQDIIMPAPTAASLGKYIDVPVSYHTGIPNISVPIYQVVEGPLSLDIGLSYHASGIRVSEMASWVGLGWSLQAGGMVSRTVMGIADDDPLGRGYYHTGGEVTEESLEEIRFGSVLDKLAKNQIDGEADLFSFHAGGLSGKFYIDQNQEVQLVPKQDIKIEYVEERGFQSFTILAADGTRYIFGKYGNSTALEKSLSWGETLPITSSWYLVRIESSDRYYHIDLEYETEYYSYRNPASCKRVITACDVKNAEESRTELICPNGVYDDPEHLTIPVNIEGKRLRRITSSTSAIDFMGETTRVDLDPHGVKRINTAKRLDEIQVSSGTFCYKYQLNYDYYEDFNKRDLSEGKRLQLLSLQQMSCDEMEKIPPYSFEYEVGPLGKRKGKHFFPYRLSKATDHWGYYNGQHTNDTRLLNIPETTLNNPQTGRNYQFGSSDRSTDERYMMTGILTKVNYPTGGHSQFIFEANRVPQKTSNLVSSHLFDKVPSLTNCTPIPDIKACCSSNQTVVETFTLENEEDIANAHYTLSISPADCDADVIGAFVRIYRVSDNMEMASLGATEDQRNGPLSKSITEKLENDRSKKFTIGQYRVELKSTYSNTNLRVYSLEKGEEKGNNLIGGLRIKEQRIHNGESVDDDRIIQYDYSQDNDELSSGILIQPPLYLGFSRAFAYSGSEFLGTLNGWVFQDNSFAPLHSFEGRHVGYRQVKVKEDDNGSTHYTFHMEAEERPALELFPIAPYPLKVENGKMLQMNQRNEEGDIVAKSSNIGSEAAIRESEDLMVKIGGKTACRVGSFFYHTTYRIRSSAYRVIRTQVEKDQVATITDFTFDMKDRHEQPTKIAFTNSDGKRHQTQFTYIHDLSDELLKKELLKRNQLLPAIETQQWVANEQVDGSRMEYHFFGSSTGTPSTFSSSSHPYPYKFYRFEKTWQNGQPTQGKWELQGTIESYHPFNSSSGKGYPKRFRKANWPIETYEWQHGLISKRRYLDFEWKYNYHPGTRLVAQITDIDGQYATFHYDPLMRLKETQAREGKVKTTYQYHFQQKPYEKNYVRTKMLLNEGIPLGNSQLTKRESIRYFDGLGRLSQTVQLQHTPNKKDVIRAVAYDLLGRQSRVYEPFESTTNDGSFREVPIGTPFTLTEYQASPLNRIAQVTPPNGHPTIYQYGVNETNEVKNWLQANFYGPNSLFKTIVIDPNGNQVWTYTDKKGRQILNRRTNPTGSIASYTDTYTIYDQKDRVWSIIPPGAELNNYSLNFYYTYDAADNILSKKVPGANPVLYKYNLRDQLILMQDGLLTQAQKWLATNYDAYGRVTQTGFVSNTDVSTISTSPPSSTIAIPSHSVLNQMVYGQLGIEKGKVKSEAYRLLSNTRPYGPFSSPLIHTNYIYDEYGRPSSTKAGTHISASTRSMSFKYDMEDHVLAENIQLNFMPTSQGVPFENMRIHLRKFYDFSGRLTRTDHQVNNYPQETIHELSYNFKDELIERNLGKQSRLGPAAYLQSVDYRYNDMGWLTHINTLNDTDASASQAGTDPDKYDLYFQKLRYDKLLPNLGG